MIRTQRRHCISHFKTRQRVVIVIQTDSGIHVRDYQWKQLCRQRRVTCRPYGDLSTMAVRALPFESLNVIVHVDIDTAVFEERSGHLWRLTRKYKDMYFHLSSA